jgi:hypothetical protein
MPAATGLGIFSSIKEIGALAPTPPLAVRCRLASANCAPIVTASLALRHAHVNSVPNEDTQRLCKRDLRRRVPAAIGIMSV